MRVLTVPACGLRMRTRISNSITGCGASGCSNRGSTSCCSSNNNIFFISASAKSSTTSASMGNHIYVDGIVRKRNCFCCKPANDRRLGSRGRTAAYKSSLLHNTRVWKVEVDLMLNSMNPFIYSSNCIILRYVII